MFHRVIRFLNVKCLKKNLKKTFIVLQGDIVLQTYLQLVWFWGVREKLRTHTQAEKKSLKSVGGNFTQTVGLGDD